MGNRALKLMVVLLCTINATLWYGYTEAPIVATLWAGTAVFFFGWIISDIRNL
ncbi:MAG TPA: hypothetical protein VMV45_11385 [Casimicrobiaceae bacterium]|nr:hypothetical protein [Casimicrobiaceae bacterium]